MLSETDCWRIKWWLGRLQGKQLSLLHGVENTIQHWFAECCADRKGIRGYISVMASWSMYSM